MNLFIDTLSPKNCFLLFTEERKVIDELYFDIRWNESTQLIKKADEFLEKNNISYFDLKNIVFVNGPGSFTWVRTTTLFVNSINFIIKKNITTLTYFDLFSKYPIIKTSSKRDSFVQWNKHDEISIIPNDELSDFSSSGTVYWDAFFLEEKWISVISEINYYDIIFHLSFDNKKLANPFYIKKPNIS